MTPKQLLEEAEKALAHYPVARTRITVLSDKGPKATWGVVSGGQRLILKRIPVSPGRLMFVASVLAHGAQAGSPVLPALVSTKDGQPCLWLDERGYLLTSALSGRQLDYERPHDLELIARGLGAFHRAVRGAPLFPGAESHTLLGRWPEQYDKEIDKLSRDGSRAEQDRSAFAAAFREVVARAREMATNARDELARSAYDDLVRRSGEAGDICHQDFASGNVFVLSGGRLAVYDLDACCYDVPVRDLRKLFNKVMKKMGWSGPRASKIIRAYHSVNPLPPEAWDVLRIDLLFPHLLAGIGDKYFERRDPEWTEAKFVARLRSLSRTEEEKTAILARWTEIVSAATRTH